MKKLFWRRIGALVLAILLGTTCIAGYGVARGDNEVYAADEPANENTVVFAEGEGTGKDFSADSWSFEGLRTNDASNPTNTTQIKANNVKPGIYANEYSEENEPVIRLVNGVRSQKDENGNSTGYEADADPNFVSDDTSWTGEDFVLSEGKSVWNFRSGKAVLNTGGNGKIDLDANCDFSLKFTFSMPEAVINVSQVGGQEKYAKEYGGDGMAFVMTTVPGQNLTSGSGIGYGGMRNSFAIELDSFYNGSYVDNNPGVWGFENNGFDNQAITYGEYTNETHEERFDHIAITLNGDPKIHKGIFYLNGIVPRWEDMRWGGNGTNGATAIADTTSTCATRFTDKNVNDRLFTVWVEYDGANKRMDVSYANGDYKTAVRPQTPQISETIDLKNECFDGENEVYMGFTSAVGTSKANHTIHLFHFTNEYKPITNDSQYAVEYYLQDPGDPTKYILQTRDTRIVADNVQSEDIVKDTDHGYNRKAYDGYQYVTLQDKSVSEITVAADGTSTLKLYYNAVAACKVDYYKLNPDTEQYEYIESSPIKYGELGTGYRVADVDGDYENKYRADGYTVNAVKNDNWSVTLEEQGQSYTMNVYYDPPKTTYKTEYWIQKPDGSLEKKEETTSGETYSGKTVTAVPKVYDGYSHIVMEDSIETAVVRADGSTVLRVYYRADQLSSDPSTNLPTDSAGNPSENPPAGSNANPSAGAGTSSNVISAGGSAVKPPKTGDAMGNTVFVMLMSAALAAGGCAVEGKKNRSR